MNMKYDIYSLEEVLPIFTIYNNPIEKAQESKNFDSIDFNLNSFPCWVQGNIATGNKGEILAQLYLQRLYKKEAIRESLLASSKGYDISIDGKYFEIKTTESNALSFDISITEIEVAKEKSSLYNIFYIQIVEEHAKGFIIQNPYDTLNLSVIENMKQMPTNIAAILPINFKVQLTKDFCHKQKQINLGRELFLLKEYIKNNTNMVPLT